MSVTMAFIKLSSGNDAPKAMDIYSGRMASVTFLIEIAPQCLQIRVSPCADDVRPMIRS